MMVATDYDLHASVKRSVSCIEHIGIGLPQPRQAAIRIMTKPLFCLGPPITTGYFSPSMDVKSTLDRREASIVE
jgi:hypothetical protein